MTRIIRITSNTLKNVDICTLPQTEFKPYFSIVPWKVQAVSDGKIGEEGRHKADCEYLLWLRRDQGYFDLWGETVSYLERGEIYGTLWISSGNFVEGVDSV